MSDPAKKHVRLSPSGAYRWMKCAKQPSFCETFPRKPSSRYAAEGTVAASVLENAVRSGVPATFYIGQEFSAECGGKDTKFIVDKAMCDAVQVAVDYVNDLRLNYGVTILCEQQVTLAKLSPPEPISGTADIILYSPALRWLWVIDYKHGAGKLVSVIDNWQTRVYTIGAWLDFGPGSDFNWPIDKITNVIIQPRAGTGQPQEVDYTPDDLIGFTAELMQGAERVQRPDAEFNPGEWCKWCPAEDSCPGRVSGMKQIIPRTVPMASALTFEEASTMLAKIEDADIVGFIDALRSRVHGELMAGGASNEWALKPKKPSRFWAKPEAEVVKALTPLVAVSADLYEMSILSPAGVEKIVGKGKVPAELIGKASSGFNLVRKTADRPGITLDPADDFEAVTP